MGVLRAAAAADEKFAVEAESVLAPLAATAASWAKTLRPWSWWGCTEEPGVDKERAVRALHAKWGTQGRSPVYLPAANRPVGVMNQGLTVSVEINER